MASLFGDPTSPVHRAPVDEAREERRRAAAVATEARLLAEVRASRAVVMHRFAVAVPTTTDRADWLAAERELDALFARASASLADRWRPAAVVRRG